MFNVQELATAVQHHIGVVVLLFNNHAYGNVRSMQKNLYESRLIATDLENPDFVALARSFGAHGMRAHSPEELRTALKASLFQSTPTLIEIPIAEDIPSADDLKSFGKIR